MNYKNLTLTIALFPMLVFAQSLQRQVIGSAGTTLTNGTYSVSFTLGETMVSSYANNNFLLTEGFHQGEQHVILNIDDQEQMNVSVYPNPFVEELLLDLKGSSVDDYNFFMFDGIGSRVNPNMEFEKDKVRIGLDGHSTGVYYIRVSNKENNLIKTIKVIKTLY